MTITENMNNTARMLEKRGNMMADQLKAEGTMTPAEEKLIQLLTYETFQKEFCDCTSAEAVKELLDRNGVNMSMDEVNAFLAAVGTLCKKVQENDGELSEEDLEMVAGGWSWKGFGLGLLIGAAAAAVMLATAVVMIGSCGTLTGVAVVAAGAAIGGVIGGNIG